MGGWVYAWWVMPKMERGEQEQKRWRKEGRSGGFVDHGSLPGDVLLDGR